MKYVLLGIVVWLLVVAVAGMAGWAVQLNHAGQAYGHNAVQVALLIDSAVGVILGSLTAAFRWGVKEERW